MDVAVYLSTGVLKAYYAMYTVTHCNYSGLNELLVKFVD